ncbi:hypothetical protein J6590_054163 [Homalodisca vitripennis]|nr:hypothetical protein J6590_054163 [Homalodisca vitripennis]
MHYTGLQVDTNSFIYKFVVDSSHVHSQMSTQSVNMATFLKLESRNTVNRSERFRTTREELTFILTSPIDSIDWPLAFSEYIVDHIKDGASPTDHFGITIKHQGIAKEGIIPFMAASKLTSYVVDDALEKTFVNVETLIGPLIVTATIVKVPEQFLQ